MTIWSPVAWLRALEAKLFLHKRFELRSSPGNLAVLSHGRIQTLQLRVISIKFLGLVRLRFDIVDTQTRRRRRVPNAPPRRARAPSAGTICYGQRPTSGVRHSTDLRSLRKPGFQSSHLLEIEGGTLHLIQAYRRPLIPHRRNSALNQFEGVPGGDRVSKRVRQCAYVSKSIALVLDDHTQVL
jgi:hypothetical protein